MSSLNKILEIVHQESCSECSFILCLLGTIFGRLCIHCKGY